MPIFVDKSVIAAMLKNLMIDSFEMLANPLLFTISCVFLFLNHTRQIFHGNFLSVLIIFTSLVLYVDIIHLSSYSDVMF